MFNRFKRWLHTFMSNECKHRNNDFIYTIDNFYKANGLQAMLRIHYCRDCHKVYKIERLIPNGIASDMTGFYNIKPNYDKFEEFRKKTGENPYVFPSYNFENIITNE